MEYTFHSKNKELINKIVALTENTNELDIIYQSRLNSLFSNVCSNAPIHETTQLEKPLETINLSSDFEDESSKRVDSNETSAHTSSIHIPESFNLFFDVVESGDALLQSDLHPMISASTESLEKTFTLFESQISWEGIHNLCSSLATVTDLSDSINNFVKIFCNKVLLPKFLTVELPRDFESVFTKLLHQPFSFVVCEALIVEAIIEQHHNWEFLIKVSESINQSDKQLIVRQIIKRHPKLEDRHFELLNSLYVADFEIDLKKSFIEFLSKSAVVFSDSKIFGKLFVKVCKSLQDKNDFLKLEEKLFFIVQKNNTIFKAPANKILIKLFEK